MKLVVIVMIVSCTAYIAGSGKVCGPREKFMECGTACPETCDTLGEVLPCIKICVQGCFCKEGYVRNNQTQECVLPRDCPPDHHHCNKDD